ncbi:MAG TPA: hypothetical protein VGF50_03395 [Caulobacteraceae bacterium]
MSARAESCGLDNRREAVRASALLGLDSVDVSPSQTQLDAFFLGRAPQALEAANIRLTGGAPVNVLSVQVFRQSDLTLDDWMEVVVDQPGDASTYTLSLVETDESGVSGPMPGVDPIYGSIDFSFKASCPSDADCLAPCDCPPPQRDAPPINYLAKDYASFRQLILDRLAQTAPDWTETHTPDIGVMLVDLLAYVGDQLSYYQDAVATEAYLGTARRRISLRRHARLVDYKVHEGCNARAWVTVNVAADCELDSTSFFFSTRFPGGPAPGVVEPAAFAKAPPGSYVGFEPLVADLTVKIGLKVAHNEIRFYAWGDCACCLPVGTISATLADYDPSALNPVGDGGNGGANDGEGRPAPGQPASGRPAGVPTDNAPSPAPASATAAPRSALVVRASDAVTPRADAEAPPPIARILSLKVGDVLMFEEVLGPKTGAAPDADPTHRQAVRLTSVAEDVDPLFEPERGGLPVLRITWCAEDKLTFPLCLSAVMPAPDCTCREGVSVARGNVILVDQGLTQPPKDLGTVPTDTSSVGCPTDCEPPLVTMTPGPFHPVLEQTPLTFAEPLPACLCAVTVEVQDPRQALPEITLTSVQDGPGGAVTTIWRPLYDLLESGPGDAVFVIEVDDDQRAHLRFGNGDEGRRPAAGEAFTATYRIGDGPDGNVGPESICYLVFRDLTEGLGALVPRNMLAALGGTAPEAAADVRMTAPYAFRDVIERAITAADYATLAKDNAQRLAARNRPSTGRHAHHRHKDPCLVPFEPLQNAQGSLRWNGSWYEARVAVDPLAAESANGELLHEIDHYLARYRRIGHDLDVVAADYVALDLGLSVCVKPLYLRAHVEQTVRRLLGTGFLADGSPALFNPDSLTFGQAVFVSPVIAAVQGAPGVLEAQLTRLDRLVPGRPPPTAQPDSIPSGGRLVLGPSEIARLDQDPNAPGNGRLTLLLRGGR